MRSIVHSLIFTFLIFSSVPLMAQGQFTATANPSKVGLNEYVTIRYVLKDASRIRSFRAPSFSHFTVISGPNEETSMSNINGTTSQYVSLSYILKPDMVGRFSLPGAEAMTSDKKYTSNPLLVTVVKGSGSPAQPQAGAAPFNPFAVFDPPPAAEPEVGLDEYILRNGESVAAKVEKNMSLRLETDKTTCYVGEPIVASYNFYTRLKSESKLSRNPSFNGFSVIDLLQPDATLKGTGTLNGKTYNKFTIRKAQLYPLQAGEIQLEAATIENDIQFLKESATSNGGFLRDLRNGFPLSPDALIDQHVSLSSKPVTITVKPLPEAGKPAGFHGAVGSFNIDVVMQKSSFSTDESGVLTVTITGNGNLHLVTAPDIFWPQGIEAYDPVLTDALDETQVPISGTKTFTYNFTADKEGNFNLPAIQFPYFDPATASYKYSATQPASFTVTRGSGLRNANKAVPEKTASGPSAFDEMKAYWWIGAAFILVLLFILFRSKKEEKEEIETIIDQSGEVIPSVTNVIAEPVADVLPVVKRPLEETEICLAKNDCDNFYRILNRELRQFLSSTLKLPVTELNRNNLEEQLDKCDVDSEVAREMDKLLQEIEWQLYTPSAPDEEIQDVYRRSVSLVETINTKCNGTLKDQSVNL